MRKPVQAALIAAVAAAALSVGIYLRLDSRSSLPDSAAVSALTQTQFEDLSGKVGSLEQWRGRVLVVNFWASWCPPCREEIPGLVAIRKQLAAKGLEVVGIAVDSADKARESAAELGVDYPVFVAGVEIIDLTRRLGNRPGALPYTLILDRNGKLVAVHLGIISVAELTRIVAPLLG
ncbi:MAG TPA: TlpA disulfide reductase family protein [Burkholderiales bacterium]|jgi:thiol-disulfide isomerase/thioredoxin|nr:TlpA disulfide reductase family protein [Burkholderiales bacterium]